MGNITSIMKIFNRILRYSKKYKALISLSILSSILYAILNSLSIWLIGTMLGNIMMKETIQNQNPSSLNEHLNYFIQNMIGNGTAIEKLKMLCIILVFIFIVKNILFYFGNIIITYVQNKVITNIRIKLFKHVNKLSLSFFNKTKSAELSSIFIRDIAAMRVAFSQSLQKLIVEPISIISFVILLFIINAKFALLSMTAIPICGYVILKIGASIRRKSKRSSIQIAGIMNIIKETLSNIKIVKSFNMEDYENEKFNQENKKYFQLIFRQSKLSHLLTPLNEMIGLFVGILLIWFGGIEVLEQQSMNVEDFIKFILLLFAMMQPIRKLANINTQLQTGIAASERVFEIFDQNERIKENKKSKDHKTFNSDIKFENIYFKYNDNENYILEDINTKIKKGKITAIVGPSGSGKSTFIDLISRFYEPQKGTISIDSVNINEIKLNSLYKLIGIVTQNTILFNDTIKNNIIYGNKKATDKEIKNALLVSNLSDFINKLPKKLNTVVGENGIKLSGGEKQRISIARAILKNPQILILDEATASLDSESEKKVHKAIDNIIKDRTVIIIAHRLSTIMNANKIIVIDKGKLVEQGNHKELIEISGKYKKLFDTQFEKNK